MFAVLRRRNFALLWSGQLISRIGDWVLFLALPYYTYQLTGSVLATGAMYLASTLPGVLLGSVAGVCVDRWSRKRTMIVMDMSRVILLLLLLAVRSRDWIWLVYLVNMLVSTCSLFFAPAKSALLPSLVEKQELLTANAWGGIGDNLPRLLGPLLGGVLLGSAGGFSSVVLIDSATFLFSGLMIWQMAVPSSLVSALPSASQTTIGATFLNVWREWKEGLQLLGKEHFLLIIFIAIGITGIADSPLTVLLVPFVTTVLQSNAVGMGWILVGRGIGGLLGGLLVALVSKVVQPVFLMIVGLVATGVCAFVLANVPHLPVAIISFTCAGVAVMLWAVSYETLLQQHTTDTYRGRVFGSFANTAAVLAFGALALVSATGNIIGIVPWFNMVGTLYLLAAVIALLLVRKSR